MIKGLGQIKENLEKFDNRYLSIKDGESVQIRIVGKDDDIVGTYEHFEEINGKGELIYCLGKGECPLCAAGRKASFRTYIPVLDTADNLIKIFKVSKGTLKTIIGLKEEYGDLTEREFKVTRRGKKFDTTYQFYPRDKSPIDLSAYDIPDIEKIVKPKTREEIEAMLDGIQAPVPDETTTVNEDDYPF